MEADNDSPYNQTGKSYTILLMLALRNMLVRLAMAISSAVKSEERRRFDAEVKDPELVFRRYFDQIYRYCRQRVSSNADAEDITAQVFTEAIKTLPKLRWQGRPVLALLYTVAGRRITDHMRRRKETYELDSLQEPASGEAPVEVLAGSSVLGGAIADLPEDQRVCVYLQLVQGHSFAEVAAIVGRSEKACKGLVYRGLAKLRIDLEREGLSPA